MNGNRMKYILKASLIIIPYQALYYRQAKNEEFNKEKRRTILYIFCLYQYFFPPFIHYIQYKFDQNYYIEVNKKTFAEHGGA